MNLIKYLNITIIIFFSFFINWYSANLGVMPIDTFGFFDTGYNILNGQFPIRDYWAYTGITVDYLQSLFFLIFGNNWHSYIIHSSFINVTSSLIFYFFLRDLNISKVFSLFYTLSFATLLYPVSGTPFAYLHAYIFSILGIMIFFLFNNLKNRKLLIFIPSIFFFAFFSMQTPSIYIGLVLLIFIFYLIVFKKEYFLIESITYGSLLSILFLIIYLFLTDTSFKDLIYQYFLFPISIGDGRMASEVDAYVKLSDQLNFKRIFGDFKFIHVFLIPLIIFSIKDLKKNKVSDLTLQIIVFIFCTIFLIYNQLLQANQIYIFSLIPILAALLHAYINKNHKKNFLISWILIVILSFISFKYHLRFNVDRKFIDLENIDKSIGFKANTLHANFKGLYWLTNLKSTEEDKLLLQKALEILKKEKENSYIFTHYQFFSTILNEKFYILNRWYLWDNNSHPTENHKYFAYYKKFASNDFDKNKIKNIYLINEKNEISFKNIRNYFDNKCFTEEKILNERLIKLSLKNCN
tara:strand:+ start:380 stop:1945 length:1566 start_codon:yes stop_codon:yes gene_type:complete